MNKPMDETQFSSALHVLEKIVDMYYTMQDEPGSKYVNHTLGDLHGFKWAISCTFGEREKDRLLHAYRTKTGRAIPHTGIMDADGTQLGWDSDAG